LLYWLPLIFVLWSNVHIQFIYGLFAVALFAGINLLQRAALSLLAYPDILLPPTLPLGKILLIAASCVPASCVGPYSFHLYHVIFAYSTSKFMYSIITELQALSFTGLSHYLELMLAAGAFFALGCQKKLDPFKLSLLVVVSVFAFRTTRDAWFLCITAAAFIADLPAAEADRERPFSFPEYTGLAIAIVFFLLLIARNTDFNQRGLDRTISNQFPVDAVNFLRKHSVGGPLYNSFNWGGFLIFYMPQYEVAIDGRSDAYGDELSSQFYATESANAPLDANPYLNDAGVVLLDKTVPLAKLLPTDRRSRVIHPNPLALIFTRN